MSIDSGMPDLENEAKESDQAEEDIEIEDSSQPDLRKRSKSTLGDINYKTYTEEFDEIIKAEELESTDELTRLRKNLDQQLLQLKNFISKLASHGYIVLALYHGDDRFEGTEPRRFSLRPLAINKAIDKILADPTFSQNIDQDRIGGVGESFGGATMLALMGAKNVGVDPMSIAFNSLSETVNDSRVKAAATIVPYAGSGFFSFFGANGIGASFVDRPFMANSSNADEETEYKKIEDVIDSISGAKYLIEYDGEPHSMSKGALADAYTWIKIFLDAYVKQEASSIEILSQIKSVSGSGADSLVKAVEPASPVNSVAATFLESKLFAAGVKIADNYYDLGLVLQTSESPFEFLLTTAVSGDGKVTAGSYSDSILNIPLVQVDSDYYAVQFKLTSSDPYIFTLTNAESASP